MRANFVVAQAGILQTIAILLFAKLITITTAFSISALSTNTDVKGGGAYFLISRTLGPEFGGAIGLALYLAQTLSIPFYIIGFTEAVTLTFPVLSRGFVLIGVIVLFLLFILAFKSADIAIKAQYLIMAILTVSIAVFLIGAFLAFDSTVFSQNLSADYQQDSSFWKMFAIYFPAVTGIMTGINMSGDLKKPAVSLPLGTFMAIGTGLIIYLLQIILCGGAIDRESLLQMPYRSLMHISVFGLGFMVAAGVLCATLSSALGSLMGAPRILQALGADGILKPVKPFSRLSKSGEPRRALVVTVLISVVVLVYGAMGANEGSGLNMIAAVVSELFLIAYGITNLAAFVESFGNNPSFRPRFRFFHWSISLLGAIFCVFAAFLIDAGATAGAVVIIIVLFVYVRRYVLAVDFSDARGGFIYSRIRENLLILSKLPVYSKNWRPTSLVLIDDFNERTTLVRYSLWLGSGSGIVTLASVVQGQLPEREKALQNLQQFIKSKKIEAFPQVIVSRDIDEGIQYLLQSAALGPVQANLMVQTLPRELHRAAPFVQRLKTSSQLKMSQVIIADRGLPEQPAANIGGENSARPRIDIWWRGRANGSLMVVLAYLLSCDPHWKGSSLRILRVVSNETIKKAAILEMNSLIEAARIRAETEVIVAEKAFSEILQNYSADAAVVFLGFRIPEVRAAEQFLKNTTDLVAKVPTTILIHSSGDADITS